MKEDSKLFLPNSREEAGEHVKNLSDIEVQRLIDNLPDDRPKRIYWLEQAAHVTMKLREIEGTWNPTPPEIET